MSTKSTKTTEEFKISEINELIRQHLGKDKIDVDYVISEVASDPLGMYPGMKIVTKVRVTYDESPSVVTGPIPSEFQEAINKSIRAARGDIGP